MRQIRKGPTCWEISLGEGAWAPLPYTLEADSATVGRETSKRVKGEVFHVETARVASDLFLWVVDINGRLVRHGIERGEERAFEKARAFVALATVSASLAGMPTLLDAVREARS